MHSLLVFRERERERERKRGRKIRKKGKRGGKTEVKGKSWGRELRARAQDIKVQYDLTLRQVQTFQNN